MVSHISKAVILWDITAINGRSLDADAFAYFQEKGIFNKSPSRNQIQRQRTFKGGTELPMELYKIQRSGTESGGAFEEG